MKSLRSRGHRILAALLVQIRKEAGLSQEQLAERLKKPQSYIAKTERGERRIDPVEMYHWARGCDIEPIFVFVRFAVEIARKL